MPGQRIAVIDHDKCFPDKCGWLCQRKCPVNRVGKDCITQNTEKIKAVISEELCTGCGICPKICPFGAITIINLDIPLEEPVHQYGENSFRLHRLPIPRNNAVVGMIGRNGTGKSTAFNILSGIVIPNLGKWNEKGDYAKIKERFKGKELHAVFDKIESKQLSVSIKPQHIEKIPRAFTGSVRELFQSINREKTDSILQTLELEKIAERKLPQLSGGELQKVAIGAAALKHAQLYFIDEPSSYLDIRERLRIAGFLRGLVNENTAMLAVEHDLILLDYLSDYVHLMYGEPAVFGVVSNSRATREGINTYLDGYAKDENYRFRANAIHFEEKASREVKKPLPVLHWPNFTIEQGTFSLHAESGTLNQNEVIGILGPNGIGKTTFVKTLAGLLTPKEGPLPASIPVSYKPQYLEAPEGMTVQEYLDANVGKEFMISKHLLVEPLHLPALFEKQMDQLSGGELQRVAIASALGKDVPLILLDEPSAHLDVEQRLQVAKTIRSLADTQKRTILVVDHDLLFMDYVSDRLLLFEGNPGTQGKVRGPMSMEQGMNGLLSQLGITLRRDPDSKRPRINKPGSVKDVEQKRANEYYYTKA